MILIPARLAASLDADDLARVVLHESAHLQRYDDWLNALEQVVCALQFFQPALHVARRGIDFEREIACDDRVLAAAGEPLRYAECLARIVQRSVRGRRVAVAPGFVLRRGHVLGRVRRIVDRSRDASPRLRFAAVALTAIVLAATLGHRAPASSRRRRGSATPLHRTGHGAVRSKRRRARTALLARTRPTRLARAPHMPRRRPRCRTMHRRTAYGAIAANRRRRRADGLGMRRPSTTPHPMPVCRADDAGPRGSRCRRRIGASRRPRIVRGDRGRRARRTVAAYGASRGCDCAQSPAREWRTEAPSRVRERRHRRGRRDDTD